MRVNGVEVRPNMGIGLPSSSTKSPFATPVMYIRGMPAPSANCRFVSDRATASVSPINVDQLRLAREAAGPRSFRVHEIRDSCRGRGVPVNLHPAPVVPDRQPHGLLRHVRVACIGERPVVASVP